METFLCDRCCRMFYAAPGTACVYCQHLYVIWVTNPNLTAQEIVELLERAEGDPNER